MYKLYTWEPDEHGFTWFRVKKETSKTKTIFYSCTQFPDVFLPKIALMLEKANGTLDYFDPVTYSVSTVNNGLDASLYLHFDTDSLLIAYVNATDQANFWNQVSYTKALIQHANEYFDNLKGKNNVQISS